MITVKFIGGAKKSFQTEQLEIDKSEITVENLFLELDKLKPANTPELDTKNSLIAINGVDSSAIDGKNTTIRSNDVVSIIPIIHGGSPKRLIFESQKKQVQILEIKGDKQTDIKFIDKLRERYPKLRLQAISSRFILNSYHLKHIIFLSLYSEKHDILLSKKFETDLLLRFALTKQISTAIKTTGIESNRHFILIGIGGKTALSSLYHELSPNLETLFSKTDAKFLRKHFKITQKHLDSVDSKTPLEDILVEKASVLL